MASKLKGGILATIGYILSPLSWWNDIFINLPLAYAFAFPFGLISKEFFFPMMIFGYWITNVLGFMLMHAGVKKLSPKEKSKYSNKEMTKDISIAVIYTAGVFVLVKIGWLKFPLEYFS